MVETIKIVKDWRCLKTGQTYEFKRPGVNLLVGDQGCGKSSMLMLIQACGSSGSHRKIVDAEKLRKCAELKTSGVCQSYSFDFEKDNFRTKGHFDYDKSIHFHLASMWKSHGESSKALLSALSQVKGPNVVIIDEPDTALSVKSIFMLEQMLKGIAERGGQVIAAVHNPFLILAFNEVLSLEHGRWMGGREFIDLSIKEYREKKDEKEETTEGSDKSEVSDNDSSREQVSGC